MRRDSIYSAYIVLVIGRNISKLNTIASIGSGVGDSMDRLFWHNDTVGGVEHCIGRTDIMQSIIRMTIIGIRYP
jgi:hypothetical protein